MLDRLDAECDAAAAKIAEELQSPDSAAQRGLMRTHSIPLDCRNTAVDEMRLLVKNLFGGEITVTTQCGGCGNKASKSEVFYVLSLDVPHNGSRSSSDNSQAWRKRHCTLMDTIERFTAPEVMSADCGWRCDKCKECKGLTRTQALTKMPHVLCLHLKRFDWTSTSRSKLDAHVEFPLTGLDMSRYGGTSRYARPNCSMGLTSLVWRAER